VTCSGCGADLPIAFPGATVTCVCGKSVQLASGPSSSADAEVARASGGPYRSARASALPIEVTTSCPFCSNPIGALVRICPHCDVRLDSVRCARCFSLQAPGTFACARCGEPMELEPLLDATDAPCPRCRSPLEVANTAADARTHECPRCGGIFVSRDALADILCRAEIGGALSEPPPRVSSKVLDEVRYLPCPLCHATMNRANFGKVSGVIVDLCSKHGTWFDAGELTRVVAFAARGGLERSRAREREEQHVASVQAHASHAAMPFVGTMRPDDRLELWRDFLSTVLRW
jgi:Zn-finger nucleic acid-binding protein